MYNGCNLSSNKQPLLHQIETCEILGFLGLDYLVSLSLFFSTWKFFWLQLVIFQPELVQRVLKDLVKINAGATAENVDILICYALLFWLMMFIAWFHLSGSSPGSESWFNIPVADWGNICINGWMVWFESRHVWSAKMVCLSLIGSILWYLFSFTLLIQLVTKLVSQAKAFFSSF